MKRYTDQVVCVTGAGRGIGRAVAERFAQEGADLILISNEEKDLLEAEADLRQTGCRTFACVTDVSDPEQVDQAVARALDKFGKIDVLINNAGIAWEEDFLDISASNWNKIIDVNLNGMFYVAQRVSRQMAEQGGGVIVNMASTNGLVGEEKYAHYNASKGGVVLLTKTMALELGAKNIRVNAVCPGYIRTPMSDAIDSPEFVAEYIRQRIPLGRAGTMKDVAGVFAFLASEDAAFIHGEMIVVDGGQLAM
ncbi:SDR family NAD(P)-dependent oxidoreductase [Paenibacillus sp. J2TS4]|uniref:SDR family NAD(P)-dependent oxidoreductase n=1 Tax=Paenibacillus sp. J2TS4 TaxID=2807194 RepID=UPI001B0D5E7F|nr:glucose 1-dehydrogenase [Paenibacillus sp. J2TS4]GIP35288.1 dehydrogenase [Paenibacillus sp. J2TS4]